MTYTVLDPLHVKQDLDLDQAKALFKKSVSLVEIETFSYCNRRCWYCPNSFIDRFSHNTFMAKNIYNQILADLASIDYDGEITFSRYNEPLADRRILDRIRLAKTMTNATLRTHTNGDYLTPLYLDELYQAGLRKIYVQVYLNGTSRDIPWTDAKAMTQCARTMERIGLALDYEWGRKGATHGYRGTYRDMDVFLECKNFGVVGLDRGGLIQIGDGKVRAAPCFYPVRNLYIDYNGAMMPCCNLRSDAPKHEDCILYELTGEADELFKAYVSEKYVTWRSRLLTCEPKEGVCRTCKTDDKEPSQELVAQLQSLTATYG